MIAPAILLTGLIAGQAVAPSPTPPAPTRWSILSPSERCLSQPTDERDIVVCARLRSEQRLPLPDEREPRNRPRQATGEPRAALENGGEPCAIHGCLVGFGPPIVPLLKGAVGAVKTALAKRPDKRGRSPYRWMTRERREGSSWSVPLPFASPSG